MTAKLVKWASSDGQITKSWLSGRRNADFLLPVVGFSYDGPRIEGHLGNVGLRLETPNSKKREKTNMNPRRHESPFFTKPLAQTLGRNGDRVTLVPKFPK